METTLAPGPIATDRRVMDHAGSEPETPRLPNTSYDRELERVTRARAYYDDTDPVNAAIRRAPTQAMLIAAGIGFAAALLMR